MFSSLMDKIGIMDIIAPLSEVHPLVLAIQQKNFAACLQALENGNEPIKLKSNCTPLHLASEANFLTFVEYLINNQISNVGDLDQNGDTPLHYAARNGGMDSLTFLVTNGSDVLLKNRIGQTAYDVASNLSVRQYLLPLQLKTENDRGLAPVLPGVTTAQSLGLGGNIDYGPPPGPMSYGAPSHAPPPNYGAPPPSPYNASPYGGGGGGGGGPSHQMPPPSSMPPQVHQQPVWQPPHPDGFASGPNSQPHQPHQTHNNLPQPPNQYSAFNGNNGGSSRPQQGIAGRYVAYGQTSPPPSTNFAPPAVSVQGGMQGGYSQHNHAAYQQPTNVYLPPASGSASPQSPGATDDDGMVEVSLSSNSSSVM